jgi:heme A synthase
MREVIWIRHLTLIDALLALCVIVLGGYTRLSNSGLGCPDWPGCFGHIAPTGSAEHYATASDVRKAWVEMIHRYAASTLGLIIVVIAAFAIRARRERGVSVWFALTLLALVVFQGILGMLTVTWLLKPLIVTGHLLGGLTTFAMLLWLWLTLRAHDQPVDGITVLTGNRLVESGARARVWATLALAALGPRYSSAAGPAATTPPWPARIFRNARRSGFRMRTTATPSCCGAASASITRAEYWITRPVSPSTSRTGWARCWPPSCCCSRHSPRCRDWGGARAGQRSPCWRRWPCS